MAVEQKFIPDNVFASKRILGFKRRNLIEGIIEVLIVSWIIFQVPFLPKVKWIFSVPIGIFILGFNYFGIAGDPLTQVIINYFQYIFYTKQFSYRRIQYGDKEREPVVDDNGKVRTIKENKGTNAIRKAFGK